MSRVFGFSYLLDCFGCKPGVADDLELHYRFLETLVDKLGMTRMIPPIVIHAPRDHGVEVYPDKAGVSGWVGLVESGVQIHSLEPTHFITLDVYSCQKFDPQVVVDFAQECFGFQKHEGRFIVRGEGFDVSPVVYVAEYDPEQCVTRVHEQTITGLTLRSFVVWDGHPTVKGAGELLRKVIDGTCTPENFDTLTEMFDGKG